LLISAEKIMDCLNDGVYVCDLNRRIVFWSKSAERITGWRSEDVLGRACLEDILNHEDIAELFYRFQMSQNLAITPDVQLILNPEEDTI
jgi:PAS domain S-box-containing protein